MTEDEATARHIDLYGKLFAEQVEHASGWPKSFTFPEPTSDIERKALRLFIEEMEQTTGAEVIFSHRGTATVQ